MLLPVPGSKGPGLYRLSYRLLLALQFATHMYPCSNPTDQAVSCHKKTGVFCIPQYCNVCVISYIFLLHARRAMPFYKFSFPSQTGISVTVALPDLPVLQMFARIGAAPCAMQHACRDSIDTAFTWMASSGRVRHLKACHFRSLSRNHLTSSRCRSPPPPHIQVPLLPSNLVSSHAIEASISCD